MDIKVDQQYKAVDETLAYVNSTPSFIRADETVIITLVLEASITFDYKGLICSMPRGQFERMFVLVPKIKKYKSKWTQCAFGIYGLGTYSINEDEIVIYKEQGGDIVTVSRTEAEGSLKMPRGQLENCFDEVK